MLTPNSSSTKVAPHVPQTSYIKIDGVHTRHTNWQVTKYFIDVIKLLIQTAL